MIAGSFRSLADAAAAVEKKFDATMPEGLFLLSRAFCTHQARISARWPRPGHAYSSVDFITSDGHNIATWIPDVSVIMWHATPDMPHGRPCSTKIPGTYTVEDFATARPAPPERQVIRSSECF